MTGPVCFPLVAPSRGSGGGGERPASKAADTPEAKLSRRAGQVWPLLRPARALLFLALCARPVR
jgi:hypothetical protein